MNRRSLLSALCALPGLALLKRSADSPALDPALNPAPPATNWIRGVQGQIDLAEDHARDIDCIRLEVGDWLELHYELWWMRIGRRHGGQYPGPGLSTEMTVMGVPVLISRGRPRGILRTHYRSAPGSWQHHATPKCA